MPKKTLTAAFVDAIKVEVRTEYFDKNTSGLGLRVSPSGNKTFFYRYRYNGRNRRYKIGKYSSVMTLKNARDRTNELRLEVKKGGDPQGEEQSIKSNAPLTFGGVVDQYKASHLPTLKQSTQDDYTSRIEIILKHFKKDRYVKDIYRGDIFNFLESIKAPVQAQRIQAILSGIFKFALDRDWVEYNPATGIRLSSKKAKRNAPKKNIELTNDQIIKLWQGFEAYSTVTGSLFKMLLVLGQRSGETRQMEWGEIDFKARIWTIPGNKTKNGLTHYVPLTGLALDILEEMKPISENKTYVFQSPTLEGKPLGSSEKGAERIRERTKVSDFNIHSLRTTAATKMASLGISQQVLSKVLNHKTSGEGSTITAIYNQYDYETEKRDALTRWNNQLVRILAGKTGAKVYKIGR